MSFIVAIDGPSGTGKGTMTSILAKKYNLVNIDTGATYRCVTLAMQRKGIKLEELDKIKELLKVIDIKMERDPKDKERNTPIVYLDGEDVSEEIRSKEVTQMVSPVSAIKEVRLAMADLQRKMAKGKDVIMEGRDIGTVIFPNADVKIYLDASQEERVKRRYEQNKEKGIEMSIEEVRESIEKRDESDRNKEMGALKQAEDAIYVDTTGKSIAEVEKELSNIIDSKKKAIKAEEKIYKFRKETIWKKIERKTIKGLIHGFYVFLFRLKKNDEKYLNELDEPVIICANHINTWDAVGIVTASKKKIRFVAKEELFFNNFLNWLAHLFDVIPVKRGMRDMKFMKTALGAIKNKENLGIFPEGTRKGLEKGAKVQNGAAYIAMKTNVKVIPIGINGTFKPFRKVYLNYGKPIDLSEIAKKDIPEKEKLDLATKEIMDNIIMLTKKTK